ncbi:MAG: Fe-S cluster assembly protein HesB [Propionibacteriales bacterium]|nr:Fe-S cluster assembly protein HesB [Propionibacteriales bacterium]
MQIRLVQDPDADTLLSTEPFALLMGMMLDQQVLMEHAFAGPAKVKERFGSLDPAAIAAAEPEAFVALCAQPPAVHRFPKSMAARIQSLARHIEEEYGGDTARLWEEASSGKELLARLRALPGFGKAKSQIFLALLGKQAGVQPDGWREAAGDYGEEGAYRSVADIVDPDSLARVRAHKAEMKAKRRA